MNQKKDFDVKLVDSEEKNLLRKKRDAERKRLARSQKPPKKRSEMTDEELNKVREIDRVRKQNSNKNLTNQESEKNKIKSLILMRKMRLLQSEEKKSIDRYKARNGMKALRKEGPMRKYVERIYSMSCNKI